MIRRNEIKNVLDFRFRKIASSDEIQVTDGFRNKCVLTERNGEITRQPFGIKPNNYAEFKNVHLSKNYTNSQGLQHLSNQYSGRNR